MQVDVILATADQEPILANLFELYSHDFSEITDLELNTNGRFGYKHLPLYWQEGNRYPFLIKANDNLAGFVLVRKSSEISGDENVWDVAEFFIVRRYRRHRVGIRVAHEVWKKFLGLWEVRVTKKNTAAQKFWNQAIASFMGLIIEASVKDIEGKSWNIFCFDTEERKVN